MTAFEIVRCPSLNLWACQCVLRGASLMELCPARCGYSGLYLKKHLKESPVCDIHPTADSGAGKRKRDPSVAAHLFANRIAVGIGQQLLKAQVDRFMKLTDLDVVLALSIACASQAIDFIQQELTAIGTPPEQGDAFQSTMASARKAFTSLPSAGTLVRKCRAGIMRAVPRFLGAAGTVDRKGACFFSAHQLVAIMLQENAEVRKLVKKSSDEWKTGSLYQTRPDVLSDLTHGTQFLDWHQVCGEAAPDEANDLRVVLHGWTDGFTPVDGLSQAARRHKYDAFLATLVNLPLHLRHYVDHVLLLALCNSRYAKQHGGLVRMLTGFGADGHKHDDAGTLACELALGKDSPVVSLPNDADPKGAPIPYRLRLFLLLISLDWLASGEFGPFAGSVSATHPCGKCHWHSSCPCAYLSRDDPRRQTIDHAEGCRQLEPRTHAEVFDTVKELRLLEAAERSKTKVKQLKSATGIFSSHFASEHLLRDVVADSTTDIMHVFLCGKTRYLLSWVTDELIPRDFSWAELNSSLDKYISKEAPKGTRITHLERSKGDKRGSCSIHLNAAEMMAFKVARCPPPHPSRPPPAPCVRQLWSALRLTARPSWALSSRTSLIPFGSVGSRRWRL